MTTDPHPILPYAPNRPTRCWREWVLAGGGGLAIGLLLGVGMAGGWRHGGWAGLAGIVAGLAVRGRPVGAALGAGVLAAIAAVATVVVEQYRSGYWPIRDEFTVEHYGTEGMAVMRISVFLLVLVCGPALVGGAAVALGRWCAVRLAGSGDPLRSTGNTGGR